jgi:hypothetical protein
MAAVFRPRTSGVECCGWCFLLGVVVYPRQWGVGGVPVTAKVSGVELIRPEAQLSYLRRNVGRYARPASWMSGPDAIGRILSMPTTTSPV